ncbi:MAG: nucleoside deaminase [Candidatus Doudnabacteria bacterium]|nr:nucleoside deaminase [Candidatus Doudnabacteria bacterium]
MMNDEQFMQAAIEEARKTEGPKKFGTIVVKDGKIIAKACTTVYVDNDPTRHAEIIAISNAARALSNKKLENCILYSTCEPCMMCTGAALWAGIKEIVYGMNRKDYLEYFEHSNHWHKPIEEVAPKEIVIRGGVLRDKCKEIFLER